MTLFKKCKEFNSLFFLYYTFWAFKVHMGNQCGKRRSVYLHPVQSPANGSSAYCFPAREMAVVDGFCQYQGHDGSKLPFAVWSVSHTGRARKAAEVSSDYGCLLICNGSSVDPGWGNILILRASMVSLMAFTCSA